MRREPDLTLEEIQGRLLDERQRTAGIGSVWRFFDRHGISFKQSVRAAEQDRPDVAAARMAWADGQTKLDPERLSSSTKPARAPTWPVCAAELRGERLSIDGHWKHHLLVVRWVVLDAIVTLRHRRSDGGILLPGLCREISRASRGDLPTAALRDANSAGARNSCRRSQLKSDRAALRQNHGVAAVELPSDPSTACRCRSLQAFATPHTAKDAAIYASQRRVCFMLSGKRSSVRNPGLPPAHRVWLPGTLETRY